MVEQDEGMINAEIDHNNNNSEEEDKEEKEEVGIEFTEIKVYHENDIEFIWSDIRGEYEEDIAKVNLIESLQNKLMKKFSQKNNWRVVLIISVTSLKRIKK